MITDYLTMMLGVSAFIAFILLLLVIWAVKSGQFDDKRKMLDSVLFDGEDDLNELAKQNSDNETDKKD